jgi:hypothetical protein
MILVSCCEREFRDDKPLCVVYVLVRNCADKNSIKLNEESENRRTANENRDYLLYLHSKREVTAVYFQQAHSILARTGSRRRISQRTIGRHT